MKMHTKSHKAIAAILDVAVHGIYMPVTIAAVSQRLHVSVSYLEQLFQKLRLKGLVVSRRGPGGGYRIARHISAISVADVISAVDSEATDCNPCNGIDVCHQPRACLPRGLWCGVNAHLRDYLRSVTLESILAEAGAATLPIGISPTPPTSARLGRTGAVRQVLCPAAIA